jgi:hypothetical protein
MVMWRGPCSTQKQTLKFISGLSLAAKAQLLSLTGQNPGSLLAFLQYTLIRHSYLMEFISNSTCRMCGTEEETSVHILCKCEALASLRHAHVGSFFLDTDDSRVLSIGAT